MTFGKRLIEIRKEYGYNTRTDFAVALGIPSTTLRNYETDAREPGHKFLKQVSELLNVSVDYLLCITDKKEITNNKLVDKNEYDLIKKYRELDDFGKRLINSAIDIEYDRCIDKEKIPCLNREPFRTKKTGVAL